MYGGRGYQPSGIGFGPPVTPQIIKQLMIANAIVFLGQFTIPGLAEYGALTPAYLWPSSTPQGTLEGGYLWQPFTYMWLHGGLGHIAMNMFALWMFGSQLAMLWGPKRFLRFYLVCGIGAGIFIAVIPLLTAPVLGVANLYVPTVGASGAIYGVLLAYSLTWPDRTIMLIFPPVAFRAIWLIPGLFFMTYFFGGTNVSHVGHLGGVVVAWFYLRRRGSTGNPISIDRLKYRWRRYRMRQKLRSVRMDDNRRSWDDKTLH